MSDSESESDFEYIDEIEEVDEIDKVEEDEEEEEEEDEVIDVDVDKIEEVDELIIIPDNLRQSSDILTEAEYASLIGLRSKQIEKSNVCFTDVTDIINPIEMAQKELFDKKCPLMLRRNIGRYVEHWNPNEMGLPFSFVEFKNL